MADAPQYPTLIDGAWHFLPYAQIKTLERGTIWSGRLSTGIFGSHTCPAGNRGPKSRTEVIVAPGDEGLEWLIRNSFPPRPACKPHETPGFEERTHVMVDNKYGSFETFTNPAVFPYDAARLPWEDILPVTLAPPGRLYVPKGLADRSVRNIRLRFRRLGYGVPELGSYDADAPGRFRAYP